ncbi:MAG: amidohydrolase family protein [Acidimicrobiia bacterium]|nr:amidohydrolase family protein [Acidimicrobiia bacterium]
MADLLLRSVTLPDGSRADVRIADGRIAALEHAAPAAPAAPVRSGETAAPGEPAEVHDLDGYLLLPAPAEPHAHLDKALTADLVPNPQGDLAGAIEQWMARYPERTVAEITGRARRAALAGVANGATAIRTHVDINDGIGLQAVEALLAVKEELAPLLDLQLVGLVGRPVTGPEGRPNRDLLLAGLDAGVDVVGGCPHLDADPQAATDFCLEVAAERGLPLDLHMDEHLRPAALDLEYLARRVLALGVTGVTGVTASHCCSLGVQDVPTQRRVAEAVAAAGISVVTLPQTNLYLQARDERRSPARGLTAVASLLEAGANVAGGADNLQDPFNTVGRADPLETASLLVMAAHLGAEQAYRAVSGAVRHALGLAPVAVEVGAPAELLAVRAGTVREAIAFAPADRVVTHRGRVVASTTTTTTFPRSWA